MWVSDVSELKRVWKSLNYKYNSIGKIMKLNIQILFWLGGVVGTSLPNSGHFDWDTHLFIWPSTTLDNLVFWFTK